VPEPANRYDQVSYPGRAYPEAHPDRLAVCARLHGLEPQPVEHCRMLELGCGNGAHLLALAVALPHAKLVGIDRSERAIAEGMELVRELGLTNVRLEQGDFSSFDGSGAKFDYVVSHGVYSWVPPAAQDALLAACQSHLAPHGVAYVSYNTYPGAHARELVREMMLFHAGELEDPLEKVARGVEFVRFVRSAQPAGSALAATLDSELRRLDVGSSEYVFHDDFSEYNVPVYFAGFFEHAATHGLKFLSEADFSFVEDPRTPAPVREQIKAFAQGDPIAEQQYVDFVLSTAFRRTLLCHEAAPVSRELAPSRLLGLRACSPLQPSSATPELRSRAAETFTDGEQAKVVVEEPLAKAALLLLARAWPHTLAIEDLIAQALDLCGAEPGDREPGVALARLSGFLLRLAAFKQLELRQSAPCFVAHAGHAPCASPLARAQIRRSPYVTSLRHLSIRLEDEPSRILLELLDGKRTRTELLALLRQRVSASAAPALELTATDLDGLLARMATFGLLTA
jgi:SAM-dependent methyltransferase